MIWVLVEDLFEDIPPRDSRTRMPASGWIYVVEAFFEKVSAASG